MILGLYLRLRTFSQRFSFNQIKAQPLFGGCLPICSDHRGIPYFRPLQWPLSALTPSAFSSPGVVDALAPSDIEGYSDLTDQAFPGFRAKDLDDHLRPSHKNARRVKVTPVMNESLQTEYTDEEVI